MGSTKKQFISKIIITLRECQSVRFAQAGRYYKIYLRSLKYSSDSLVFAIADVAAALVGDVGDDCGVNKVDEVENEDAVLGRQACERDGLRGEK